MPRIDGGLEIVCGDGELTVRLQRSVRSLSSELSVRVRGELTEQQIEGVLGGVLDSGERLTVLGCEAAGGEGANRWYAIAARGASGKDVRQLFERQGAIVSRVLRTRLGTLALERSLGRGHYRELTREEIEGLLSEAAGSHAQEQEPQGAADADRPPARPKSRQTQAPARPKSQTQAPGRRRSRGPPRPPVRRGGARH
jgi:23S rRNA pseudouridine2605 synthase